MSKKGSLRLTQLEHRKLLELQRFIVDHPEEDLRTRMLVQKTDISARKLNAGFQALWGKSVQQLVLEVRMRAAMIFLTQTDLPIKEVAFHCGYAHLTSFYRRIKAFYAKTPDDFRRC